MASAKQIAWRKKFARMSKAGKFRKKITETKSKATPRPKVPAHQRITKVSIKRALARVRAEMKNTPKLDKKLGGKSTQYVRLEVQRDELLWKLKNYF